MIDIDNKQSLSIIIPVYNEEPGLPFLFSELETFTSSLSEVETEIIFVDDNSKDDTPNLLAQHCKENKYCHYLRLSKNSGSHIAIIAGMSYAKGDCVVFMAADLQDPPELICSMIQKWRQGNQIVWAVREKIEGISWSVLLFGKLFYLLLNRFSQVKLSPSGADFALLDRRVVKSLIASCGSNPSLSALIASLGYRSAEIRYVKKERKAGRSKWTVSKKIKALIDAFVQFSFAPMRAMIYVGFIFALIGFTYALVLIILRLFSYSWMPGWTSLMVIMLIVGGIQMVMLGILGEYLWRNLEESRKRPLYFIEESSKNFKECYGSK